MIEYFLLGVLAPIFLNLIHMVFGVYVVITRGGVMSLGFTGMGFITKTIGLLWLTWLGIVKLNMDFQIYVPLLTFFWFFTHIVEAFIIQHFMNNNVPEWLQKLQLKQESVMTTTIAVGLITTVLILVFTFYVYKDDIHG